MGKLTAPRRRRKRPYKDVYLKKEDLTRLRKGYVVVRVFNGSGVSIKLGEAKKHREITRLKDRIKTLEGGKE